MSVPGLICRLCAAPLAESVIDLGATPLANAYLPPDRATDAQPHYPLRAFLCGRCGLLQLELVATPDELFQNYAYFSSVSETLLEHSEQFAEALVARWKLGPGEWLLEIASNDGYLLQFFQKHGLEVLGVEPARNVAASAVARGIPTVSRFFGTQLAADLVRERGRPRLIVANNVVAHVPDLNDFLEGIRILLAHGGLLTLEFHHVLNLVEQAQFDNIYHEHFQYFSLASIMHALGRHGLSVVDVEELSTQGGSLRIYATHAAEAGVATPAVEAVLERERMAGLDTPAAYRRLAERIAVIKADLLAFLASARKEGKSVVCFGAAAKGNTLLNYCGVDTGLIDYAVDSSPHKQGLLLPGSLIPIHAPSRVHETKPDYLLILPWNISKEIKAQMTGIRDWGGQFVIAVPVLRVVR